MRFRGIRCSVNKIKILSYIFTWFECLDSHWSRVIPDALPDLSELAVAELSDELQAVAVDLPLVSGVVGQVGGHRFVNLKKERFSFNNHHHYLLHDKQLLLSHICP